MDLRKQKKIDEEKIGKREEYRIKDIYFAISHLKP